ncbi:MAG: transglycosylase domain-containing protein, partial [Clostridiales bacterium]|nr:transglycosylase domain-containing protein [Clostridiales bacterium]
MKKFIKYSIRALGTLFLVIFLSAFICVTALFVYATRGIDASLDFEELMAARGLTSVIYSQGDDGTITEMIRLHGTENRIWTDIENVPSHVIDAFVSIEDHRFFDHNGIDTRRTAGAIMSFLNKSSSDYGGSTITQQLIKNLTGDDEITVKRKLTEIMRALKLEKSVSKTDILEAYLNTVYLSNGCYGIETASEYFFSKPVSELSLSEGAALAAILKYPYKYDPVKHPENNDERRKTVLFRMYELGKISKDEYESAINEEIKLNVSKRITAARHLSWFEETVIDEVRRDLCEKYGYSKSAAADMIYGGGLSIVTTVDPEMQTALEKIYENERNFPTSGVLETPESAAVIIDSKSGALLAVVGARGEKTSDRILNYATRLTRSPGSVIKPISVYAPALDKGIITWATVFDDVPVSFSKNDDGSYTMWPKNNPRVYSGLTNVNHALETSINTVSVRILQKLKARYSYSFLKNVGITTLVESRKMPNGKIATDISEAPLALGAVTDGCTLYQLCGAYSFLADGGVYRKPYSYTAVYDRNGNPILENSVDGER